MLDSLLTVPKELTQSERDTIVEYFENLPPSKRSYTNHFDIDLLERPTLFVKYGIDVLAQASTQSFFYALAQGDTLAPRIPKVYDAFFQKRRCFFVMEKIEMPTISDCDVPDEEAVQSVASAVKWLFAQIRHVPKSVFGRISSEEEERVWHGFFKDDEAPVPFVDSKALSKYVIKAFMCRPVQTSPPICFSDKLVIYHSDIRKDNFLYNVETQDVWIIDFQHIGALPEPFQTFAFFNIGNSFGAAVGRHLGYKPSDLAREMTSASWVIHQTAGNANMGLDKFGERVPRRR